MKIINREFLRNLILYGIIGGVSAALDALIFALLYKQFGISEWIANCISTHCGIFLSFFLNSRFNFKKSDHLSSRFFSFYLTGLFGLALSYGILFVGNRVGWDVLLTKLASIVIVALVQFFINRAVAFRDR